MSRESTRTPGRGRAIVVAVSFLAALTAVAWRQSTTRETMAGIQRLTRELAVAADEREELVRELVGLEGRPWIGAEASRRLDLRAPRDREVVIAAGGSS